MANLITRCPKCEHTDEADESFVGYEAVCEQCGHRYVIQDTRAATPSETDAPLEASRQEAEVSLEWSAGDVILDLYEVIGLLGEGGMGKVYQVRHRGWNVDLAVKCPRAESFETEVQKQDFVTECATWINLGLHPHTVSCYYVRNLGGIPRVFAEYVEGGSLQDWIRDGRLYEGGPAKALERILDIAIQFAWGLHYAHEQGLVHQDVKPGNVMMTEDGTVKVTDFGLAKARAVSGETSQMGGVSNILVSSGGMTPAYCSPEQATGEKLTIKTDIWSWAVSVLEMFSGGVTWPSGTVAPHALESLHETGPLQDHLPQMPDLVYHILRTALHENAEKRPPNMERLGQILADAYQTATGEAYSRTRPTNLEHRADSLHNQAVSHIDLGNPGKAEELWRQALEHDPHHLESTYSHGLLQWRNAEITDAELVRRLEEVRTSHEDEWRDEFYLALVHLMRSDVESAVTLLEEVVENGGDPEANRYLSAIRKTPGGPCLRTFEGHAVGVNSVSLGADGRFALSGSDDSSVRLWDVESGQCLRTFEGHTSSVESVCLGADGRLALSGSRDSLVRLWDVESGPCFRTFEGHAGVVTSVSLSADGRFALSGSLDRSMRLWDVESGKWLRTYWGHADSVKAVCLGADGRFALSGSDDKLIRLWDVKGGKWLRPFEGHTDGIVSVSLSADGRSALSGSLDRTMRLWDVESGQCLRPFEGHRDPVTSVCLGADGRLALSGSRDSLVRLWDVESGQCLRTFEGHTDVVTSVSLSADGRFALSGSQDGSVRLWDLRWQSRYCETLKQGTVSSSVEEAKPENERLKILEMRIYERTVTSNARVPYLPLCRVAQFRELGDIDKRFKGHLQDAEHAIAQGDWGVAHSELCLARSLEGKRREPRARNGWAELSTRLPRSGLCGGWRLKTFRGHSEEVESVSLSADGRFALSGSDDKTVRLWDVESGQCLRTFEGHAGGVKSVILGADARFALSGSLDTSMRLWDVESGPCLPKHTFWTRFSGGGGASPVTSVSLSADGRFALSGSRVQLWDVENGDCIHDFKGHPISDSVCLAADARFALLGRRRLGLWDVRSWQCLRTFEEEHTGVVNSISLGVDGRFALSGSDDKTVRLWDVESGQCLRTFEGHTDVVTSVCLSTDGRFALSGSSDRSVRLWGVASGQCLRIFRVEGSLRSVCWSRDGNVFLVASGNNVHVWWLDWDLEPREPSDWDEAARPHLEMFLRQHVPYAEKLPENYQREVPLDYGGPWDRQDVLEKIDRALTREGRPRWSDDHFNELMQTLGCAGLGWLRPDGVRRQLDQMTAEWSDLPPYVGEHPDT